MFTLTTLEISKGPVFNMGTNEKYNCPVQTRVSLSLSLTRRLLDITTLYSCYNYI